MLQIEINVQNIIRRIKPKILFETVYEVRTYSFYIKTKTVSTFKDKSKGLHEGFLHLNFLYFPVYFRQN